jgi:hypothetical protein
LPGLPVSAREPAAEAAERASADLRPLSAGAIAAARPPRLGYSRAAVAVVAEHPAPSDDRALDRDRHPAADRASASGCRTEPPRKDPARRDKRPRDNRPPDLEASVRGASARAFVAVDSPADSRRHRDTARPQADIRVAAGRARRRDSRPSDKDKAAARSRDGRMDSRSRGAWAAASAAGALVVVASAAAPVVDGQAAVPVPGGQAVVPPAAADEQASQRLWVSQGSTPPSYPRPSRSSRAEARLFLELP